MPGAISFDRGQAPNILTMAGLEGSIDLFLEIGLKSIQAHNQKTTQFFLDHFNSKDFDLITPKNAHANIVCLKSKNQDVQSIKDKLLDSNVDVSIREGNLRISFHLFNNLSQVEILLKALN